MPESQSYSEKELLLRIAEGDELAFAKIVAHHTPIVFRYLLLYIKNAATAEELAQDIFMRIWHNRHKLADMQNFPGYIYVATRNRALMELRTQLHTFEEPPRDMLQRLQEGPESGVELKDLANTLHRGIELLPARRREVFKLSRFEHLTYEEIAAKLSISRSAVNQHINAAMTFLRAWLREETGVIITALIWFSVGR